MVVENACTRAVVQHEMPFVWLGAITRFVLCMEQMPGSMMRHSAWANNGCRNNLVVVSMALLFALVVADVRTFRDKTNRCWRSAGGVLQLVLPAARVYDALRYMMARQRRLDQWVAAHEDDRVCLLPLYCCSRSHQLHSECRWRRYNGDAMQPQQPCPVSHPLAVAYLNALPRLGTFLLPSAELGATRLAAETGTSDSHNTTLHRSGRAKGRPNACVAQKRTTYYWNPHLPRFCGLLPLHHRH